MSRCVADGDAIRARVEEAGGCDGALDEYLECHQAEDDCDFEHICTSERADLEVCIGAL